MKRLALTLAAVAALSLPVASAGAWGNSGHRMVGVAAMQSLPEDLPAFLRTAAAATEVGELSREPDRWKGGGRTHDRDRDTAHFIDLDDAGRVMSEAGPAVTALPELRSEYERVLTQAGLDVDDAGYLPYALVDGYQQLIRDFGYWRVLSVMEARETDPGRRAWYREDRERREALLLRDIGVLSHYVGDGAQPLHLTIHYNGWGDHPNPEGFTTSRQFHGQVDSWPYGRIDVEAVRAAMAAPSDCAIPCPIRERVPAYMLTGLAEVPVLYRLEQSGALAAADDTSRQFMLTRLAAGASELRDLITAAWRESAQARVGWPAVRVAEVEDGTVSDPWDSMFGAD
jgi:hypothetical protein